MISKLRFLFLSVVIVLACAGCNRTLQSHGYDFDEERVAQIKPQKSNLQEVMSILGTPTASAIYGEPKFFYISHQYKNRTFLNPKIVDQKILEIVFERNGVVKSVARYDMRDLKNIEFNKEKTHLPGNDISVIEQFIGNIGKFNNTEGARKAGT